MTHDVPVQALLLDVMGTLVYDPFHIEMPAFFGMELHELLSCKHPDAWVRFERGEMEEPAFLDAFFRDGRSYDQAGFQAAVFGAYRLLDGIEPLLEELRDAGVPMHALSNYPSWYHRIEARVGLSRFLKWTFVSCDTGVRKPDPEAYLGPARALGLPPSACLFVDDRESNCEAARAVGMRAVRFEGADGLREALRSAGLRVR
ncbi:MAG: HAD family hydrolase [Sandaracinaceae bacterium]